MIFDSHAHLLSDDQQRYPPSPLSGHLAPVEFDAPTTAERLLERMKEQRVVGAVAVQRAHVYGFNNAYVLDSAARYPDKFVGMCMLDATAPGAPEQDRGWVRDGDVTGIRMTEPVKGADPSWFASAGALRVWEAACEAGASIRLHFYRWNRAACLPALSGILQRMPEVTVVLDHLSNMSAEAGPPDHGVDAALLDLVRFPRLHLLFSTINLARLREAGIPSAPVIARVVQEFGAERILWGSDVGQSKGSYAELVDLAQNAVSGLSAHDQALVMHDNGLRVYRRP